MAKLKKIETFDEHSKKFSISDIKSLLPSEKECEEYANGAFGYDENSFDKEYAFLSGTDWMRDHFNSALSDKLITEESPKVDWEAKYIALKKQLKKSIREIEKDKESIKYPRHGAIDVGYDVYLAKCSVYSSVLRTLDDVD
jgi:hypothetical protein